MLKIMNFILSCTVISLIFSCFGNRQNTSFQDLQQNANNKNSVEIIPSVLDTPVIDEETNEISLMIEYFYEKDNTIREKNQEIIFLEKANFGVPEGENWIVMLKNDSNSYCYAYVYSVDGDTLKKYDGVFVENFEDSINLSITQDIPGKRLGNSFTFYGDYNGDGINEILYLDWGFYNMLQIIGYDKEMDKFVFHCNISFALKDENNDPTPIKYKKYNGKYGFELMPIIYSEVVFNGTEWVAPEPHPDNGKWIYFAWDSLQRQYVRIGEINNE
jgi:hypothetical protein